MSQPEILPYQVYWWDAELYLERYKILSSAQYDPSLSDTSWNTKLFCDLMMSYECLIKSMFCYNQTDIHKTKKLNDHFVVKKSLSLLEDESVLNDDVKKIIISINDYLPESFKDINYITLRYHLELHIDKKIYKNYCFLTYEHGGAEEYNQQFYIMLKSLRQEWHKHIYGV